MILNIIGYYNKKICAFTQPQYVDIDADKCAIQLKRSIYNTPADEIQKISVYRDLEMYFLGTFDDEKGTFHVTEPQKLLDCTPIVDQVLKEYVKEDESNGQETD